MSSFLTGCLLLLSYLLLIAGLDVYVGHLTQDVDPVRIVFWCFLITLIFFISTHKVKNVGSSLFSKVKQFKSSFFLINLATATAWLSYFISLKFIEPMLVAVGSCAITPVLTVYFSKVFRSHVKSTKSEVLAANALTCVIIISLWQTYNGKSAVGVISNAETWIGFGCTLLCGVGMTFCTLFSKKLNENGFTSHEIMATRFWLLVLIAGLITLLKNNIIPESIHELYSILIISLGGNIVGLYLLQKGIERLEPLTVSFFFAGGPIAVLPFQLLDSRLNLSTSSLILAVMTVFLMSVGILARKRIPQEALA